MITTTIKAIYENGILKPAQPLDLKDGFEVEVVVVPRPKTAAEIIEAIVNLPEEGEEGGEFSGSDHDKALYCEGEYGA